MMSSGTSTDATAFRPWHFFALAGLVGATIAVVVVRPSCPAALVLLGVTVGSAAFVGFAIYRTLLPLAARDFADQTEMIGGRTRAALEREKTLVLRAIKELEFDRAMGKLSDADFQGMGSRLRARAIVLMRQLDIDSSGYRGLIERELAERLKHAGVEAETASRRQCAGCWTNNESDARFCKKCGKQL